jgi:uncharacterized membrane protein
MHSKHIFKRVITILLITIGLLSTVSALSADNLATQKGFNSEYAAYANFLSKLDSTNQNSIPRAKNELLSRFRGKKDESANDAFRAFSKFYANTISGLERGFSSKPYLQEVLSKIADVTGLGNNPFPAFDKLDNASAREIKKRYSQELNELHQYTRSGFNFGQSEGNWFIQGDPDFLLDVSSITSGEYREYLGFNAEESKQKIADDGAILIPWDGLRKRIIREENFAKQHPKLPETETNIKGSMSWMMNVYLSGIDNSPIDNHGVRLDPDVQKSYEAFLKENSSSQYYNVIRDVYAIWAKSNFKTSRELVDYLKEKGYGQFTYMLEKALPKNKSNNALEPNLLSRAEGSILPSARTKDNGPMSSTLTEEPKSLLFYQLSLGLVGLSLILILLRIGTLKKGKLNPSSEMVPPRKRSISMGTGNRKYILTALFLILFILAALGLRLWALNRMLLIEGPANMRMGYDGLLYIVTDSSLYIYNQEGYLFDIIPLSRFGIEKARGDFWIFNNGDLLLRRETNKRLTWRRELETFFRTGSSKEDRVVNDDGILLRCSKETYECKPFGHGRDAFSKIGAFKVLADEEKDAVYITDTSAHQLLLYGLDGNLKRKSDIFFHYPNGIVRGHDGLLYIADTNHHRVAAVNPAYDSFGRVERNFSILNSLGPPDKVWPFALGQDSNNRWWVINAENGMRNGDLMIYSSDGQVFRHVELPDNADPTSIAILPDRVLITDVSLMRVYSLALNGELQDDFGSLTLKVDSADKLRKKNFYALLSSTMLYMILAAAVAALVIAWKAQAAQRGHKVINQDTSDAGGQNAGMAPFGELPVDSGYVPGSRIPASQGWLWISDALRIVRRSSRIYVVLFLVAILNWQGTLRIPQIGHLLALLLSPMIMGMLMLLSRRVADQNSMDIWNMKLRPHVIDLLLAGTAYCLAIGAVAFVVQLISGRSIVAVILLGRVQDFRNMMTPGIDTPLLIGMAILLICSIVVFAASWFTPPLIVFKKLSFERAMMESFKAALRNYWAFNLYGIVLSGFIAVSLIAIFLIPTFIFIPLGLKTFIAPFAAIMAFLFWAAIGPIITLSVYTSYVRIFEMQPIAQNIRDSISSDVDNPSPGSA